MTKQQKIAPSQHDYTPPSWRNFFVGIIAGCLFLLMFSVFLPEVVKAPGAVLLVIPHKLGLVREVRSEQVQVISAARAPEMVELSEAGKYAIYTDDTDLLEATVNVTRPWMKVNPVQGQGEIPVWLTGRGLRLYDTLQAKGRPIIGFEVPAAGQYELSRSVVGRLAIISVVPDFTTGRERLIWQLYLLQVGLVVGPIAGVYYYRHWEQWAVAKRERQRKREEMDRFITNFKQQKR